MLSIGTYISEHCDSPSILDVGCGTGLLLNYINKSRFYQYSGLDLSLEMIKVARDSYPNHEFIHSDYLTYCNSVGPGIIDGSSSSSGFDVIVFNECFHYFVSHQQVINDSIKLLNKNGSILISHPLGFNNVFSQHNKNRLLVPNLLPTSDKIKMYLSSHPSMQVKVSPDVKDQHYLCILQRDGTSSVL